MTTAIRWCRGTMIISLLVALLAVTGCASDPPAPSEESAAEGFPVTIEHLFGITTIHAKPKRVVTLGGGDMETATARHPSSFRRTSPTSSQSLRYNRI